MFQNLVFNQPLAAQLAPIAFLAALLISWALARWQKKLVASFGNLATLKRFSKFSSPSSQARTALYLALGLLLIFFALADPQVSKESQVEIRALNAVLICDASRSMDAEDGPGGIPRHKLVSQSFSNLLKAYRGSFGVIYFTDSPQSYGPSKEREDLLSLVDTVCQPSFARGAGSDLAAGLQAALQMIKDSEDSPEPIKAIILLSDGGDPLSLAKRLQLASALREAGVVVFAGGIGGDQEVKIPVRDPRTGEITGYYRYGGELGLTRLDEEDLRYLASATGGIYRKIEKGDELIELVRPLSQETQSAAEVTKVNVSVVWLPLSALLLIFLIFLIEKRFIRGSSDRV